METAELFSHFFSLCQRVWGGSSAVKSISIGIDTFRYTNNEGTEKNNAKEEGSLNSSIEKIEQTAQAMDFGTTVDAAGFPDMEYSSDLLSSESTRKQQKQVSGMLRNSKNHKLASTVSNESLLLQLTKEDIGLKHKLLERIERSNEEFKESFASINNVMQTISNTIQQSIGILAQTIKWQSDQVAGCFPQS